jgi:hypothetical protein
VYAELLASAIGDTGVVLLVTFGRSLDEQISEIHAAGAPQELRVVAVGASDRSAATAESSRTGPIRSVERPGDLTGLGTEVARALDSWQGRENVVVCFHSLTELLEHATLEETFRVLHVLINRLETAGATGFFHLDRDAHDPATIATIQPLFDDVRHQMDYGLDAARELTEGYFGSLLTEVAESSPVSRSQLVVALARLHCAARATDLENQDDVTVVERGATEVVLAIPAVRCPELGDDLELRQREAARQCHRRMAAPLGIEPVDLRDPFAYPY